MANQICECGREAIPQLLYDEEKYAYYSCRKCGKRCKPVVPAEQMVRCPKWKGCEIEPCEHKVPHIYTGDQCTVAPNQEYSPCAACVPEQLQKLQPSNFLFTEPAKSLNANGNEVEGYNVEYPIEPDPKAEPAQKEKTEEQKRKAFNVECKEALDNIYGSEPAPKAEGIRLGWNEQLDELFHDQIMSVVLSDNATDSRKEMIGIICISLEAEANCQHYKKIAELKAELKVKRTLYLSSWKTSDVYILRWDDVEAIFSKYAKEE